MFASFSHLFLSCQYLFTLRKYRVLSLVKILRHPRERFKSYPTRTSLVQYDLNLTLGCHIIYYLAPLLVLDPIYLAPLLVLDPIKIINLITRTPLATGCELMCAGRVSCSCSTSGTRRINVVAHPVMKM
jgi:hypothetical protein